MNHTDRAAIGVCMITGKAICAECSTRYDGVNYSREGLEILRRRRTAGRRKSGFSWGAVGLLAALASPGMAWLLFVAYELCFEALIDLSQLGW